MRRVPGGHGRLVRLRGDALRAVALPVREPRAEQESQFPADFICEGVDQTRGWFYSLHAIAALVKDAPAYTSCLVTGLLMAEDGRKMSKSLGNTVDPWEAVDLGRGRCAALVHDRHQQPVRDDALLPRRRPRGVAQDPGHAPQPLLLLRALREPRRLPSRMADRVPPAERSRFDRWILSRLHGLVAVMDRELDALEVSRAGRALEAFVLEDLSNWYVRRSRDRFWAARAWRRTSGRRTTRCGSAWRRWRCLMAPYAPFVSERRLPAG